MTAEVNGKKIEAVARIRRNYIEGIVANENEIWEKVVDDMRSSGDANEANIADIIEEARRQSYSTLAQGGVELDLSIERNNYGLAINTYRENITEGTSNRIRSNCAQPDERLRALVSIDKQTTFSFYEKINHTPLGKITDLNLRAEIAKKIIDAEIKALFENGVFDPDGHPGNWLIDLENNRIVRIDYAQMRRIPEEEKRAFRNVFAELTRRKPDFSDDLNAKDLARLLEVNTDNIDLVKVIKEAAREIKWTSNSPQERLFILRRAIQEKLPPESSLKVSLSDTLRSGFASLGKISGFKEYMSTSEFYSLFAKYSRAPKALTILSSWMDRARSTFSYFSIGRQSTPTVSINQSLSIPGSLEVIRRHDIPNDDISSTTREKTIPTSKKTPPRDVRKL